MCGCDDINLSFRGVNDGSSFDKQDFVDYAMKKFDKNDDGEISGHRAFSALAKGLKGVTLDDVEEAAGDDEKLDEDEMMDLIRKGFNKADENDSGKLSRSEAKDFFNFGAAEDRYNDGCCDDCCDDDCCD